MRSNNTRVLNHKASHRNNYQSIIVQKKPLKVASFPRGSHNICNQQPSAPLTNKWKPTEDQQAGVISRVNEFFTDELNELQEELNCPDEFIYDLLEEIQSQWSSESCYSKARQNKRDNPESI